MTVTKTKPVKSDSMAHSVNTSFTRYVAFLRGINVGGHKIVRMEKLNGIFLAAGFTGVKTLIQSGNVIFSSTADDISSLKLKVEELLLKELGFSVMVILLRFSDILAMLELNPFGHLQKNKKTRFYVSLLPGPPLKKPELPMLSETGDFEVIRIEGNCVYFLSHETTGRRITPNTFIENIIGHNSTTRNWNTIEKLVTNTSAVH